MSKNFVVYKSSAGSGKTYTLVKEYLKLALSNKTQINFNFKRILALTFTNKAAAEMRIRIVKALEDFCEQSELYSMQSILCAELNITQNELKERAQLLINQILHHYSDFAVSTIDSFSHKIIKTFAHDLKLPVNFNLETDTKDFYNKVIAQLISEIGSNQSITTLLKEYALSNVDDDLSWDPETNIKEFTKLIQQESSIKHINHLVTLNEEELLVMKKKLKSKINAYKQTIVAEGKKACELIKNSGVSDNDFTGKSRGPQSFFNKCALFKVNPEDINTTLKAALENNKWVSKDANADAKKRVEEIIPPLTTIAKTIIAFIEENSGKYNLYTLIYKRIYPILLLNKIQEITNELKQKDQLVFIEEFNSKIFEFIKNEPVSFIYERLGERYKNFLLDEFQDTSTLQWKNILPLIENSLAEGNFNLLVGDGKQSIYRWRNANVKQFALLPELENEIQSDTIIEQEKALRRNYEQKFLNTNYRSKSSIIEFNNALFDALSQQFLVNPFSKIYNEHKQVIKNTEIGYVTLINKSVEKKDLNDFVFASSLEQINQCLQNKYQYKDICILTDSNKKGSLIANFLSKNNISVISNDSLLLSNSIEINCLLAFFKYLQNNHDNVSATVILNYLFTSKRITLEQFHESAISLSSAGLFRVLSNVGITVSETELLSKNLLDSAVYLIEQINLNANNSANIYLRFFLDEINKFMSSKSSNLSDFIFWWEKRSEKASLIISEGINAVRIMTIHGSKGLEFPIVILPFCNWELTRNTEQWVDVNDSELPIQSAFVPFNKTTASAGYTKEIETEAQEKTLDNINKLYVAFTRAVNELHIISSIAKSNKHQTVNNWLSNFVSTTALMHQTNWGYEYGQRTSPVLSNTKSNNIIQLQSLQLKSNSGAIKIKGSYLMNSELTEHAKYKGIVMHQILSNITTTSDIDSALYKARLTGLIGSAEELELKNLILKIISHEQLHPYFNGTHKTIIERDILTEAGDIFRPDRIAISKTDTVIIDYKTGKENTSKHTQQLINYAVALTNMGYRNIKKLLVYIEEIKVIEVY